LSITSGSRLLFEPDSVFFFSPLFVSFDPEDLLPELFELLLVFALIFDLFPAFELLTPERLSFDVLVSDLTLLPLCVLTFDLLLVL
jgi:hypothetical protein